MLHMRQAGGLKPQTRFSPVRRARQSVKIILDSTKTKLDQICPSYFTITIIWLALKVFFQDIVAGITKPFKKLERILVSELWVAALKLLGHLLIRFIITSITSACLYWMCFCHTCSILVRVGVATLNTPPTVILHNVVYRSIGSNTFLDMQCNENSAYLLNVFLSDCIINGVRFAVDINRLMK